MKELPLKDDATKAAIDFLEKQGYSVIKWVEHLEQKNELYRMQMQLAACSVIALSNTEKSLAENSVMLPEYKCAAVQDVIDAVQRELDLRKQNAELLGMLELSRKED